MNDLSILEPISRPIRSFQDTGFNGSYQTWYEFELSIDDIFLLGKAATNASKTRETYGEATYFYVLGCIHASKSNIHKDKNTLIHTSQFSLSDHHFGLVERALVEYRSYCKEIEIIKINALLDTFLNDVEPTYRA